jgi:hypothetical protein
MSINFIQPDKPDTITMYYDLYNALSNNPYGSIKFISMKLQFNTINDLLNKNKYLASTDRMFMCDNKRKPIDAVITFTRDEIKNSNYQDIPQIPDVYCQKMTLRTNYSNKNSDKYDFISSYAMYNNVEKGGVGVTAVPYAMYLISVATGIFNGYNIITVYYENKTFLRILKINKYVHPISNETNLIMYYNRYLNNSTISDCITIDFKIKNNKVNNSLIKKYNAGITNKKMTDINGLYNDDIIHINKIEISESNLQDIPYYPNVCNETICIRTNYSKIDSYKYDFVVASALYNNKGIKIDEQNLSAITYYILCSSGIFSGFTTLTIYINNDTNQRIINFYNKKPYKEKNIIETNNFINSDTIHLYYTDNRVKTTNILNTPTINTNQIDNFNKLEFMYSTLNNINAEKFFAEQSICLMSDINGIQNNDIICFYKIENKQSNYQDIPFIPNICNEFVIIRTNYNVDSLEYDYICAEALYDNTIKPNIITYYVNVSSGKFTDYNRITIFFNNTNNIQLIKINK